MGQKGQAKTVDFRREMKPSFQDNCFGGEVDWFLAIKPMDLQGEKQLLLIDSLHRATSPGAPQHLSS